ncbi:MAG TPA: 4-hydroxy-3-methylbut-2-enyl diphosphate reductase [Gemmatimonadales bacterium]|nr:4-hydroxy-3-methylbut-2-enyl diphosphate reductase [Gemmatimonadales bacterium]
MSDATYFRRGFGLKSAIEGLLSTDYHSHLVEALRARGNVLAAGPLTFRLAKEFGFCYGVDRAVEYAYETRVKFPDRRLFLVGEIIHNPHVNAKLEAMGITFLHRSPEGIFDFAPVTRDDVVILPAFGVTVQDFARLRELGCVLVDTTCGSVLNVWKRVESYARDGFTAVIHGKHWHEETKATASQVTKYPGGRYLVVLDMAEAERVIGFIEHGGDPAPLAGQFAHAVSPGFDFARDLERVGFANQTTMLMRESLAIAEAFRAAMVRKHGEAEAASHVRTFDTICSATQERQDAVVELLEDPPDLMVVIGGYNSSNTTHLAKLCASRGVRTFHIEDALGVDVASGGLRHQPIGGRGEAVAADWLEGVRTIGITAGASTPNNKIGETMVRIAAVKGVQKELEEALTGPRDL